MINREIPFRPRLEGEFRVRFYNAASEITEKTPTLAIARITEREIEWVENDCQYNIEQRKWTIVNNLDTKRRKEKRLK